MATSKTAPRSTRGAVARSEANGKLRTIKLTRAPLAGLEIKNCPKELPATFSWDGARVQARIAEEDVRVTGDLYRLIESVVGEEGSEQIRKQLIAKKVDPGWKLLSDVLNDITDHYGLSTGESPASA